jgi:hypothetical protein
MAILERWQRTLSDRVAPVEQAAREATPTRKIAKALLVLGDPRTCTVPGYPIDPITNARRRRVLRREVAIFFIQNEDCSLSQSIQLRLFRLASLVGFNLLARSRSDPVTVPARVSLVGHFGRFFLRRQCPPSMSSRLCQLRCKYRHIRINHGLGHFYTAVAGE